MRLSIITPVYQASRFLDSFHARMSKAAQAITNDYEIIYVNDGSTDDSLDKLLATYKKDPHTVVIDLNRNFGQPNAIRTGLAHAKGELVFIIDDDLEEQPEWLPEFHRKLNESGADVVFSAQRKRKGHVIERAWGTFFFFFLQRMLHAHAIRNVMTARLMTRAHADILRQFKERNASFTALSLWAGGKHQVLYYDKLSQGSSSYNMRKRWRLMINHVTSASLHPLHWPLLMTLFWGVGFLFFFAAALLPDVPLFASINSFRNGEIFLIITGIAFILASLSVLGLYLSQLFDEARARPLAVIRKIYTN